MQKSFEAYIHKEKNQFYGRSFHGGGNEFQGILLSSIYDFIKEFSVTNFKKKKKVINNQLLCFL